MQRMATSLPKFADYGQDITSDEIIRLERLLLEFGQRDAQVEELCHLTKLQSVLHHHAPPSSSIANAASCQHLLFQYLKLENVCDEAAA